LETKRTLLEHLEQLVAVLLCAPGSRMTRPEHGKAAEDFEQADRQVE
jgi:hypothetical protein